MVCSNSGDRQRPAFRAGAYPYSYHSTVYPLSDPARVVCVAYLLSVFACSFSSLGPRILCLSLLIVLISRLSLGSPASYIYPTYHTRLFSVL
ncbi:hypothetical protein BD311DRAFT_526270 [Dichomitus squalens]|uniref:Uncharacterized protein n=1 Tax=Dichomitus squalens TaxID=114155 RepID=A0A4Q9MF36_9APHY|nr:hypothetical protein BD311DRAFT_526270 [Dichomitus squalens]